MCPIDGSVRKICEVVGTGQLVFFFVHGDGRNCRV